MNRETFLHLIAVNKLDQEIGEYSSRIKSHKNRIESLDNKRQESLVQLNTTQTDLTLLKKELSQKEKLLFEIDHKIKKSNEHSSSAKNENEANAIFKELATLAPLKEKLENEMLELLEKIEQDEKLIKETDIFLEGLAVTCIDIEGEVKSDVAREEQKIKSLEKRIEEEWSLCPNSLKESYLQVKKKKPLTEITYITSGNCHFCQLKIGKDIQTQVDRFLVIEFCGGCGRILCPTL